MGFAYKNWSGRPLLTELEKARTRLSVATSRFMQTKSDEDAAKLHSARLVYEDLCAQSRGGVLA